MLIFLQTYPACAVYFLNRPELSSFFVLDKRVLGYKLIASFPVAHYFPHACIGYFCIAEVISLSVSNEWFWSALMRSAHKNNAGTFFRHFRISHVKPCDNTTHAMSHKYNFICLILL